MVETASDREEANPSDVVLDADESAPGVEKCNAARDEGEQGEIKAPVRRRKLWLRAIVAAVVAAPFCIIWWAHSAQVQKQAVEAARSRGQDHLRRRSPFCRAESGDPLVARSPGHDYTSSVSGISLAGKTLKEHDLQFLAQLPGCRRYGCRRAMSAMPKSRSSLQIRGSRSYRCGILGSVTKRWPISAGFRGSSFSI